MANFDPFQPIFSQRDVGECTGLTKPTLDSYILKEVLRPYAIAGRRAFSAVQMVEAAIIHQLAGTFAMRPGIAARLARQVLAAMPEELIYSEASSANDDPNWPASARRREQVTYTPSDGKEAVDFIFPAQMVMRRVFGCAKALLEAASVARAATEKVKA